MTQPPHDDEFERRLRDVLHSRNLGVPVAPDAIDRIHAGARRRQQRRAGASALGAVAIIAIAAVAIGVRPHSHGSTVASNLRTPASHSPTAAAASSPTSPSSPSVLASAAPGPFSSAPPTSPLPQPATSQSAAAGRPAGFTPVSVSAVGLNDYWVLGYTTTTTSDGFGITSTVEQTTDGGQHFVTDTTPPADVAQAPIKGASGGPTISQIRFGDANDGWTFGSTLFSTIDAGKSWATVQGIPGSILDLVAANDTAWAIVQTASSNGASSSTASNQYALWSTSYGKAAQAWSPVALPISLGSTTPSIVDQDGTVTLMASGPSRAGNKVHVLIGTAGKPFTDHVGACEQDLGGTLSNSKKGIWAVCPHGNGASLYVSADSGATWTASKANVEVENSAAVGAIDDTTAVVFDAANQTLTKISGTTVTPTGLTAISDVSFLGFTTPAVGFAVTAGDDLSMQLLRTADGGATWSAVTF